MILVSGLKNAKIQTSVNLKFNINTIFSYGVDIAKINTR